MRPFQQAAPNSQLMLVDRGDHAGSLDRNRAGAPRTARRSVTGTAFAALAFRKLFLLGDVARSDIERNRGRMA